MALLMKDSYEPHELRKKSILEYNSKRNIDLRTPSMVAQGVPKETLAEYAYPPGNTISQGGAITGKIDKNSALNLATTAHSGPGGQ